MQNEKTKILVEGGVIVAMSVVLSFIRLIRLPWGGSVTLICMLPTCIFSIRRGVKAGMITAFTFSLVQFAQGVIGGLFGWGLTGTMLLACIFMDYIFAYSVLGLAGIFRKRKLAGWIGGIALVIFLRFMFHFGSGVIIWKSIGEIWEGFSTENVYLYSLLYNGCFMLPELIFTMIGSFILLNIPQIKKGVLDTIK